MPGEIPKRENKRGGPGWWLDPDGIWRAPSEWPEEYPPLQDWVRNDDGTWSAPPVAHDLSSDDSSTSSRAAHAPQASIPDQVAMQTLTLERPAAPKRSRQGEADVRAMLTVGGAFAAAALLVLMALILQSRAGAVVEEPEVEVASEVVFAAETDVVRAERRREAATNAPPQALAMLSLLEVRNGEDGEPVFDATQWVSSSDDCIDFAEEVLIERSLVPVIWIDNLECVPSEGLWSDPYLGIDLTRTIDAEVRPLVPPEVVNRSGGADWTPTTRASFLGDTTHPATMVVLAADSGHNPRSQAPDAWRPSNEQTWCGYAIDWIAVKARWELSISEAELAALEEMLATCDQPNSNGAHPQSMVIDPIEPPVIERLGNG